MLTPRNSSGRKTLDVLTARTKAATPSTHACLVDQPSQVKRQHSRTKPYHQVAVRVVRRNAALPQTWLLKLIIERARVSSEICVSFM